MLMALYKYFFNVYEFQKFLGEENKDGTGAGHNQNPIVVVELN